MPTLGTALDFAKLEGRNFQAHQLGTAPSSPVKGQLYYNTGDNTLYWWDGTTWQSSKGTAPDATTTTKGVIQLAGDLTGTAASPQIAAGAVTDVDVAAANKDGAVGTASMRTLGAGAQQAMPGNRTLDAITAPAADLNLNSKKLTNVADPIAATDGANKNYVDNTTQGLDAKASVRVASTANLALTGLLTVDGVVTVAGDRVLAKDQTTPAQNGIYVVAAGAWTRSTDMDTWGEVPSAYVWVETGTANADSGWVSTADQGGTLGTTSITWTQFSGAGQITAGAGLTKTGNSLDVGQGAGITVAADTIAVATSGVTDAMLATAKAGYYSSATHGAGTTITITQATHGLRASRGLIVMTLIEATGAEVLGDVVVAANGDVTVTFAASQGANTIRTTIAG